MTGTAHDYTEPLEALETLQESIRFEAVNHRYSVYDGESWGVYSGCTSIIKILDKPALMYWAASQQLEADVEAAYFTRPEEDETQEDWIKRAKAEWKTRNAFRKTNHAAIDRGKQTHAILEAWVQKQLGLPYDVPEVGPEAKESFRGFVEWTKAHSFIPLATELRLVDHRWRYAGTFDLLAELDGKLYMIDYKTGKSTKGKQPYVEWSLQSAAYRKALEPLGFPRAEGMIVHLTKDRGVEMHRLEPNYDPAFKAFTDLIEFGRWQKGRDSQLPPPEPKTKKAKTTARVKKAVEAGPKQKPRDPFKGFRGDD